MLLCLKDKGKGRIQAKIDYKLMRFGDLLPSHQSRGIRKFEKKVCIFNQIMTCMTVVASCSSPYVLGYYRYKMTLYNILYVSTVKRNSFSKKYFTSFANYDS